MNWANWEHHAAWLAGQVTEPASRWRPLVAALPRHEFVPRWWTGGDGWQLSDGPAMPVEDWLAGVYRDTTLVTQVGTLHADHATPDDRPVGRPTSSSTMPGLVVTMYRHAMIGDGMDVLDVGTGSGYGAALLTRRLGDEHVTSIDIGPYLVKAARERLDRAGLHPLVTVADATGPLPGTYDRIVSMTSVAPVPASWLAALRPGGRLVTTLAGTCLLVTANRTRDGGAKGQTEFYRAGFMETRTGPDYASRLLHAIPGALDGDAGDVTTGRYPVVNTSWAWELYSMLGVTVPGIEHHFEVAEDGTRTAWLAHPDGSWARASAKDDEPPIVRQGGPRRLWDTADEIRHAWLTDGSLPAYGAAVTISPDGGIRLKKGHWQATIPASPGQPIG
jgi:protein-L-isoaspartate O-methyltransferase